jgi:hypothetical protein
MPVANWRLRCKHNVHSDWPVVTICTTSGHYMYHQWSLYVPYSGHYMYHQWLLYVPPVVTICTTSGHYMYRTVVTICTTSGHYMYHQWSLYVPPVVTICTTSLTVEQPTLRSAPARCVTLNWLMVKSNATLSAVDKGKCRSGASVG